MKLSNSEDH